MSSVVANRGEPSDSHAEHSPELWLAHFVTEYGHAPHDATKLHLFVKRRGGRMSYRAARGAMGIAGAVAAAQLQVQPDHMTRIDIEAGRARRRPVGNWCRELTEAPPDALCAICLDDGADSDS